MNYYMYLCFNYCLPTVPLNSINGKRSTGMTETDSIQFLMASVMCGTTYIHSNMAGSQSLVLKALKGKKIRLSNIRIITCTVFPR